jgi:hypothetical protein
MAQAPPEKAAVEVASLKRAAHTRCAKRRERKVIFTRVEDGDTG